MWIEYQTCIVYYMSKDHFEHLKSLRDFLSDIPEVTQTLKDAPSVLGMNIINEPFPGNFYEDRACVTHDRKSAISTTMVPKILNQVSK